MTRLRHLAVHVYETTPGAFYWALIENAGDRTERWTDIGESEQVFGSWVEAYYAGSAALIDRVDEERIGPRAPGEDEDAYPVG